MEVYWVCDAGVDKDHAADEAFSLSDRRLAEKDTVVQTHNPMPTPCLLYTSDAADEL